MTNETEFSQPASETSFVKEPNPLEDLVKKIEELFDCRDGPYQSWVEHWVDDHYERLVYTSLGMLHEGNRSNYLEISPRLLRGALLTALTEVRATLPPDTKPILYWRYSKWQRIQEESEPMRGGKKTLSKIFTRVAIPGVDWLKVDCARYPVKLDTPYPRIKA